MKICIIGKYPPIQGGVSTRTYRYAHGLARRGHQVHVVTNADEVGPPFRVHMRDEDWARCEGDYGEGSVTVHWTNPADRQQFHIPMGTPFVSKLSSLAATVATDVAADVIFSYYVEPYAVAGHLAAEMCGLPHIVADGRERCRAAVGPSPVRAALRSRLPIGRIRSSGRSGRRKDDRYWRGCGADPSRSGLPRAARRFLPRRPPAGHRGTVARGGGVARRRPAALGSGTRRYPLCRRLRQALDRKRERCRS